MGNIAYFEVPTDNLERAKKFYHSIFGWEINSTPMPNMPEYSSITTGKAFSDKGMSYLNMGGMIKRMFPNQGIMNYIKVDSVDKTLESITKQGGKQMGERLVIPEVGVIAFFTDTEGNCLGLWQPAKQI